MRIAVSVLATLLLLGAGCATNFDKVQGETLALKKPGFSSGSLTLRGYTKVKLANLPSCTLKSGSTWRSVATSDQGTLYKVVKGVCTVGRGNTHEAFIVVDEDQLTGVYLPVKKEFLAAKTPQALKTEVSSR